jgi:hypothetical protein
MSFIPTGDWYESFDKRNFRTSMIDPPENEYKIRGPEKY